MIRECVEHGIQISFLTPSGKPFAKLVSPYLTGTVLTRREQLLAFTDTRGVALAKFFVEGKLKNQLNVLKYFAKYRKGVDQELFAAIYTRITQMEQISDQLGQIKGSCIDDVRGQIMSAEGRAGNLYWQGVKLLIEDKVDFPERQHRGCRRSGQLTAELWLRYALPAGGGRSNISRPGSLCWFFACGSSGQAEPGL
ncbi:MAG: CRISPR-associated endonuclease Cas1 [Candidatus Syntrophopropionicum ammoniitolerans]